MADKGWSSSLGVGQVANKSIPYELALLQNGYMWVGPRVIVCYKLSNGKGYEICK
jgi:hypothetical protein